MRIALLISGGGTTMEAIIKACQSGKLKGVEPVLVISSNVDAGGFKKALDCGMSLENILVINPKDFPSPEEFGERVISECKKREVNLIGQYGWMVRTPNNVIKAFEGRIVNQHPGPLDNSRPDFGGPWMYGMRVHQARLCFLQKTKRDFWTEATTHLVTTNFDEGTILKHKRVPIVPHDTVEVLQRRVLAVEHEVQIETLQDFANNTVSEFHREAPLVLPEEEAILLECKEEAKKLYPHG
jgi:folate-dependent phosphoribosylglycinamide formyltransferase PurN